MWIGNPQTWLVPLVLAGGGALAAFTKVYTFPVLLLQWRWRAILIAVMALAVTAPFLPWPTFIAAWPTVSENLAVQSNGGVSWTRVPVLLPIAVLALLLMGRRRASWMVVPTLWPNALWHYLPFAIPALTPAAAAVAAFPAPGAIVAAAWVVVVQTRLGTNSASEEPGRRGLSHGPMQGRSSEL